MENKTSHTPALPPCSASEVFFSFMTCALILSLVDLKYGVPNIGITLLGLIAGMIVWAFLHFCARSLITRYVARSGGSRMEDKTSRTSTLSSYSPFEAFASFVVYLMIHSLLDLKYGVHDIVITLLGFFAGAFVWAFLHFCVHSLIMRFVARRKS